MGRLNFALFGAGRIGAIHFKNLIANPGATVRWVVEVDVTRAKELVANYRLEDSVEVTDIKTAQKVLQDDRLSLVIFYRIFFISNNKLDKH